MNPSLLTHPNIPKPLHGINPRSIMGSEWWDKTRKSVYKKQNYTCAACGCHKSEDRFHNWLEAHEDYDIDYKKGVATLRDIVALCHSCHNFIHSGRLLSLYEKGEITKENAMYILKRGFSILKTNSLTPFAGTCDVYIKISGDTRMKNRAMNIAESQRCDMAEWGEWHLVIGESKHYSRFKNMNEWRLFYG